MLLSLSIRRNVSDLLGMREIVLLQALIVKDNGVTIWNMVPQVETKRLEVKDSYVSDRDFMFDQRVWSELAKVVDGVVEDFEAQVVGFQIVRLPLQRGSELAVQIMLCASGEELADTFMGEMGKSRKDKDGVEVLEWFTRKAALDVTRIVEATFSVGAVINSKRQLEWMVGVKIVDEKGELVFSKFEERLGVAVASNAVEELLAQTYKEVVKPELKKLLVIK